MNFSKNNPTMVKVAEKPVVLGNLSPAQHLNFT